MKFIKSIAVGSRSLHWAKYSRVVCPQMYPWLSGGVRIVIFFRGAVIAALIPSALLKVCSRKKESIHRTLIGVFVSTAHYLGILQVLYCPGAKMVEGLPHFAFFPPASMRLRWHHCRLTCERHSVDPSGMPLRVARWLPLTSSLGTSMPISCLPCILSFIRHPSHEPKQTAENLPGAQVYPFFFQGPPHFQRPSLVGHGV